MSDQTTAKPSTVLAGIAWGLAVGVAVWALYFVQASQLDLLFWDVFVLPALGLVAVVAAVVAVVRPHLREFCVGLTLGAVAMVPIAFGAFLVLFEALDLE